MTFAHQNGDGLDALAQNQHTDGARGNGIVVAMADMPNPTDCEPSLGTNTSTITIDVNAGTAAINGSTHSVGATTVSLDDGGANPRRDVVYIAEGGSVNVLKGTAGAPATDDSGTDIVGATAPLPEPPDMSSVTGVPIAVVWVPAGATSDSDLDASRDVWDRRVPVTEPASIDRRVTTIPISELAQGDARSAYLPIEPGQSIKMYKWGIGFVNDGRPGSNWDTSVPPGGVRAELVAPSGSVVSSTESRIETGDPIFTEASDSSLTTVADYWLRLNNVSAGDIDPPNGIAAHFEYGVTQ